MPTAVRKQREAEKRQQAAQDEMDWAEFDKRLAKRPSLGEAIPACSAENEDIRFYPAYLDMKKGLIQFDENGEAWLRHGVGTAGSAANAENSLDRAKTLKRKFPQQWGKRAYTEFFAKQSMAAIGETVSARTIRRYYKLLP